MAALIRITDTSKSDVTNGSNQDNDMSSLLDQVFAICQKYKNKGWGDLLLSVAKLNISQSSAGDLEIELARDLTSDGSIDRDAPGFGDFNLFGVRGIEPGNPSRSLLYHAFASPGVVTNAKYSISEYLDVSELEIIENYIFASAKRSLAAVKGIAGSRRVALCVFAYEYRVGSNTPNGKNADLCFSRTGVSRLGNKPYLYEPSVRGFIPWAEADDDSTLHVIPVRYGAFLAVGLEGKDQGLGEFGPMGKNFLRDHPDLSYTPMGNIGTEVPNDDDLTFWVPLHKLFSGTECLTDFVKDGGLKVGLKGSHINEKLKRIQSHLSSKFYDTGWNEKGYDFDDAPFAQREGLANFLIDDDSLGKNVLVPQDQEIVKQAEAKSEGLTFNVEEYDEEVDNGFDVFGASINILADDRTGAHRAPEYINVKQQVTPDAKNLNTESGVENIVSDGDYTAKSYSDFSADGWIEAIAPQLYADLTERTCRCAYSIVAPPHLIPYVTQREIIVWTEERIRNYREWPRLWSVIPWALSEDRIPPNVELKRPVVSRALDEDRDVFDLEDQTISAIVSLPENDKVPISKLEGYDVKRSVTLPDAAAGTYAPGWDTSYDVASTGMPFLSGYGLGSPFPEDAMICSALGSFWPTAAPDTTRIYPPWGSDAPYRTVAPLTDEEIGMGSGVAWDGTPAPVIITNEKGTFVNYLDRDYNDYVQNFIAGRFTIKLLQKIALEEYKTRVLAMFHAYSALLDLEYGTGSGSTGVDLRDTATWSGLANLWNLLSFKVATSVPLANLGAAKVDPSTTAGPYYEMRMYKAGSIKYGIPSFSQAQVEVTEDTYLYAFSSGVIIKSAKTENKWVKGSIPF
ncbi:hypothetical protein MLD52_14805 [Puniceicoccaceae bacterium K14]|nr:hypothetical protein [Puniceicoccaceae bacterium K14]